MLCLAATGVKNFSECLYKFLLEKLSRTSAMFAFLMSRPRPAGCYLMSPLINTQKTGDRYEKSRPKIIKNSLRRLTERLNGFQAPCRIRSLENPWFINHLKPRKGMCGPRCSQLSAG